MTHFTETEKIDPGNFGQRLCRQRRNHSLTMKLTKGQGKVGTGLKPAPTNPSRFRDLFRKWFKAKKLSVVSECHSGALRHDQGKIPPKESALVSSKKADASFSLSIGNDHPLGGS